MKNQIVYYLGCQNRIEQMSKNIALLAKERNKSLA